MSAFKAVGNRYLYIIMSRHILKNIFDSDNGCCYKFVVWRPEINIVNMKMYQQRQKFRK